MQTMHRKNKIGHGATGLLTAALLASALAAGCFGAEGGRENSLPIAVLTADRTSAFVEEEFTFDATGSADPDGNISVFRFDFGDNTTKEVKNESEAKVKHAYDEGGEYIVTLTVLDDGGALAGALSATAQMTVAVNDRIRVPTQVLLANVTGSGQGSRYTQEFESRLGVDRYVLNLSLESAFPAGTGQINVTVTDATGKIVGAATYTAQAGQNTTQSLAGALEAEGTNTIQVTGQSGGTRMTGELLVYYDDSLERF